MEGDVEDGTRESWNMKRKFVSRTKYTPVIPPGPSTDTSEQVLISTSCSVSTGRPEGPRVMGSMGEWGAIQFRPEFRIVLRGVKLTRLAIQDRESKELYF